MNEENPSKNPKSRTTVVRAVYDPTIREIIVEGDLAKMKRVYAQAKQILEQQGDLKAAVRRLEKAIQRREQMR